MNPVIDILLPTFNSASYLDGLMKSLVGQNCGWNHLWIRDDGSTDETLKIIQAYQAMYPDKISMMEGAEHLGVVGNYSLLLECSQADYIMFCDHDDIWFSDKVERSIAKIRELEDKYGMDHPLLVHTDLVITDHSLKVTHSSFWAYQGLNPSKCSSFSRLMVQNVITGCTVIINRALRDLACPIPEAAKVHDWWLGLVASAFGHIGQIDNPSLYYRQHNGNTIGAKRFRIFRIMWDVLTQRQLFRLNIVLTQIQARAFLDRYASVLAPEIRKVLEVYISIGNKNFIIRKYLMFRYQLFKNGFFRNVGMLLFI